jgi:microcystin-dependent protein
MFSATVSAGDNILASQYNNLNKDMFKVGGIILFGGNTIPTYWLECDGSAISRTAYSELFAIIGTTYGTGDGSTTFNIPDVRDRFIIGKSGTYALGSTGGDTITLATGNLPSHAHLMANDNDFTNHTHEFAIAWKTVGATFIGLGTAEDDFYDDDTSSAGAHNHGGYTGYAGEVSPDSFSVKPSYLGLRSIICYHNPADVSQYDTLLDSQFNDLRSTALMVGGIVMFGKTSSFPGETLECDGSAVSRATYANLFALIGTIFGIGNGTTTFNLPDMRDRFPHGVSGTIALGATGGGSFTLTSVHLPQHRHSITSNGAHMHRMVFDESQLASAADDEAYGWQNAAAAAGAYSTGTDGAHDHGGVSGDIGSGTAIAILPSYQALIFLIRY